MSEFFQGWTLWLCLVALYIIIGVSVGGLAVLIAHKRKLNFITDDLDSWITAIFFAICWPVAIGVATVFLTGFLVLMLMIIPIGVGAITYSLITGKDIKN